MATLPFVWWCCWWCMVVLCESCSVKKGKSIGGVGFFFLFLFLFSFFTEITE